MAVPLRFGVNALYLIPGGVGGTEIYLRSLLHALSETDQENEYFLFLNRECSACRIWPAAPNVHPVRCGVRATHRPARILYEQTELPLKARRFALDVLFNPGFTGPYFSPCPMVTVFHDLQHVRHPEFFRWIDLPFWKLLLAASARRSRYLIAVSGPTAADLRAHYRLPSERIFVVQHGVDERFFEIGSRRRLEPVGDLLLCVSTLHPHKNLERLVRTVVRLRQRRPGLRLVMAGLRGFHTKAVERQIRESGANEFVQLTGWIPREELYQLYEQASALVFPSTFEGFGMPVSEALAAGLPVACSRIPPLVEIAGPCAEYFDPLDEEQMCNAIERALYNPEVRATLSEMGKARASLFRWRRAAENTLDILRRAARRE